MTETAEKADGGSQILDMLGDSGDSGEAAECQT